MQLHWLILYHFFNFRGQTGVANNFQGFLRSLLFSLVKRSSVFTLAIAQSLDIQPDDFKNGDLVHDWSVSDRTLSKALCLGVESMLSQPNEALILFMDGLDKYEGNRTDPSQFIQSLSSAGRNKKVKIYISSRAEPPFLTLFRNYPCSSVDKQNMKGIRLWSEVKLSKVSSTEKRREVH